MKYVIFTLQEMTPEQLKQNPITVHPNQKLDTDKGDCKINKDEEESITSQELSEEDSISDIPIETTEESKPTETSQVLTVFNKTIHHEDDSSEDKSVIEIEPTVCSTSKHNEDDSIEDQPTTEIEPYTKNGEQDIAKEDKLLTTLKLKLKTKS